MKHVHNLYPFFELVCSRNLLRLPLQVYLRSLEFRIYRLFVIAFLVTTQGYIEQLDGRQPCLKVAQHRILSSWTTRSLTEAFDAAKWKLTEADTLSGDIPDGFGCSEVLLPTTRSPIDIASVKPARTLRYHYRRVIAEYGCDITALCIGLDHELRVEDSSVTVENAELENTTLRACGA